MATTKEGARKPPAANRRWHSVSIKAGSGACPAAISGRTRRWLSREAPLLPLPGCLKPDACQCTYQHHDDRRASGRRAEEVDAFRTPVHVSTERRARKDRREPSSD